VDVSELRRARQLEDENRRLRASIADQALDLLAMKDLLADASVSIEGPLLQLTKSHPIFMVRWPTQRRVDRKHILLAACFVANPSCQ
jgi:hypothetical protein